MENKHKNKQDVRLSTEAVMTPSPANSVGSDVSNRVNDSLDKPISEVHKDYDTDLARDNLENDNTFADLQDL